MPKQREELKFEITQHIADLGERTEKGWVKELNLVKWGDSDPKYDIRSWSEDHKKMGKGITLNADEFADLKSTILESFN